MTYCFARSLWATTLLLQTFLNVSDSSKIVRKTSIPIESNSISTVVKDITAKQALGSCSCRTSLSGTTKEFKNCGFQRTLEGIIHKASHPPSIILFTNPKDEDRDIHCPDYIELFGENYKHCATTFLRRASTTFGSGHYVAAIQYGGMWNLYDGTKNKSKPPFFTKLSNPNLAKKYALTPSCIWYMK